MTNCQNIKEILKITGAYVAICIGSGFATGQEIMQFYSAYGLWSLAGGVICMILMGVCGAAVLRTGQIEKDNIKNDVFYHFCGKNIGGFFKIFVPIFMFLTFIVMLSGAGAAINQYFGIEASIGRLIIAVVILISSYLKFEKLIELLGGLGNIIVTIAVFVGLISFIMNFNGLREANEVINTLNMQKAANNWWISSVIYGSLCVLVSAPFLVKVGKVATKPQNCIIGGFLGAAVLTLAAMLINLGILGDVAVVSNQQIPTLYLAAQISPIVASIFIGVLVVGIYSAAMPLLWVTCNSLAKEGTMKFKITSFVVCSIGYFAGDFPFSKLVNLIYPIAGIAGTVFVLSVFYSIVNQNSKNEISEELLMENI